MTPGELSLLRTMLREEMDVALQPIRKDIGDLKDRTKALEATDKKHDRTFAPRSSVTDASDAAKDALSAAGSHIDKVVVSVDRLRVSVSAELETVSDELHTVNERLGALEQQGKVKVQDDKGIVSIVPATTVAAQAAARAENKTDALAIDVTEAKTNSAVSRRWAKLGPLITTIAFIVAAIIQGITQSQHHP